MKPIKTVIKDLQAVLDALATDPPASHPVLQALLAKAQIDLIKATTSILAIGDDPK